MAFCSSVCKIKRTVSIIFVFFFFATELKSYRFLHLDLVDLNPKELIRKFIVELELVIVFDLAPLRDLGDDAGLAAGQRLERAAQLAVLKIKKIRADIAIIKFLAKSGKT